MMMRKKVNEMPQETRDYLRGTTGTNRMAKFLVGIAPAFIMEMPANQLEEVMEQFKGVVDKYLQIERG